MKEATDSSPCASPLLMQMRPEREGKDQFGRNCPLHRSPTESLRRQRRRGVLSLTHSVNLDARGGYHRIRIKMDVSAINDRPTNEFVNAGICCTTAGWRVASDSDMMVIVPASQRLLNPPPQLLATGSHKNRFPFVRRRPAALRYALRLEDICHETSRRKPTVSRASPAGRSHLSHSRST